MAGAAANCTEEGYGSAGRLFWDATCNVHVMWEGSSSSWLRVFDNEAAMLRAWQAWVLQHDPSVLNTY